MKDYIVLYKTFYQVEMKSLIMQTKNVSDLSGIRTIGKRK